MLSDVCNLNKYEKLYSTEMMFFNTSIFLNNTKQSYCKYSFRCMSTQVNGMEVYIIH